ncbi:MAG TPA: hypothetical protein VNR51_06195 [Hyphomicrobium sp.]|jgi:hypothetical protein|nr:hypothetical protein [Hyphomicrobium sp.]
MGENLLGLVPDNRRAKKERSEGIAGRQRERLGTMAFARANYPLYRRLYAELSEGPVRLEHLPIRVEADRRSLIERHGLDHVRLEPGDEPPEQTQGGKIRPIIPFASKGPNP